MSGGFKRIKEIFKKDDPKIGSDGNVVNDSKNAASKTTGQGSLSKEKIQVRVDSLKTEAGLFHEYNLTSNTCFRADVNKKYKELQKDDVPPTFGEKVVNKTPRSTKEKPLLVELKVDGKAINNGEDKIYVFTDKTYNKKNYSL